MNRKATLLLSAAGVALLASCASHYSLAGIERTRILVDSRYDSHPDEEASAFMAPYKRSVDSLMSPVAGHCAEYMASHRPESNLSNLFSDILVWGAAPFNEKPDFGVYNMGGIRAAFGKGAVTYGDILDAAPFENKICFLTLSGQKVKELFEQMAARGGEGVSHGVRLVITPQGKLLSASVGGKPVDPQRSYRIATLDYVAEGNDGMTAFKSKTHVVSPQGTDANIREFIIKYFRAQEAAGKPVDTKEEGRITIKP